MKFDSAVIGAGPLALVQASREHLAALIEGPEAYAKLTGIRVEPGYLEFPGALEFSLRQAEQAAEHEAHWWLPYLIVHGVEKAAIGLGGYKGPPDRDGAVEIGYGIAPAWRGRGFAALAAEALTAHALRCPGVCMVRAHTLPEENASTRVLEKAGFSKTGEIQNPEDGTVWRWERRK